MAALTDLLKHRKFIGILFIIVILIFLSMLYKKDSTMKLQSEPLIATNKLSDVSTKKALQALQEKTDDMYYMQQQMIRKYEDIQNILRTMEAKGLPLKGSRAKASGELVYHELDNIDETLHSEQVNDEQIMLQFSYTFADLWQNHASEKLDESWNNEMKTSFLEMQDRLQDSELKTIAMSDLSCGSTSCLLEFPAYQDLTVEQQSMLLDELVLPGTTSVLFNNFSEKGANLQAIFIR